mmetsp:Transcript_40242/g.93582  ORF Transcript_40242/g.93582 Transcript_40242/m.93582 type:complete len:256 (-) Transcript_40242:80-847(-)
MLPLAALRGSAAGSWTRGPSFPGPCRWGATGSRLQLEGGDVLALFGGRRKEHGDVYTYYNELWAFHNTCSSSSSSSAISTSRWQLRRPAGPLPQPRDHHGAAVLGSELYIYGGRVGAGREGADVIGDVWSYSSHVDVWTQHRPSFGPGPRYMPGVTTVSWRDNDSLAVFAGEQLPGSTKLTTLNDVWIFDGAWTQLAASDCERGERGWLGAALTLGGLAAAAGIVFVAWKALSAHCRPAVARGGEALGSEYGLME